MENEIRLNLHLFDGEGGAPSGAEAPAQDGVQAANEASVQEVNPEAEFDKFINDEKYRPYYDKRVQQIVKGRLKDHDALKGRVDALNPIVDMLSQRYGVDATDAAALAKALEEDDSYYADEAAEKGLTVEQLKSIKKIERENAAFKRAEEERIRQEGDVQARQRLTQEVETMKKEFPNFNLETELASETGERFASIVRSGVDLKTAYMVVHMDDMLGGAMQYTAAQVQQKVVNDIKARGMRPTENGGNSAAVAVKKDPSQMTRKERDELAARALRGERIEF